VDTVRTYCAPLSAAEVDTVILGCTHYPLVAPMLRRLLGPGVELISSGHAVARRVEHALAVAELQSPRVGEGDYRFMCTGEVDEFRELGTRFLQMPLGEVERLIGRSLRGVVDFEGLGERTVYVDCDVLQADGGTRCAAITGGFVALELACAKLVHEGLLQRAPLTGSIAAISCGIVDGEP